MGWGTAVGADTSLWECVGEGEDVRSVFSYFCRKNFFLFYAPDPPGPNLVQQIFTNAHYNIKSYHLLSA